MRYVVALVAAGVLIGAGAAFVFQMDRSMERVMRLFRQVLREAKAAGQLPEGIDPEQARVADFGFNVPPSMMWRIAVSHFLVAFRFVLAALLILASLGTAHVFRSRGR
jgi:hypothetical protein